MKGSTYRTYGIAIALALLVVMAGCSGPFQSGGSQTETTTATEEPTETATAAETETSAMDDTTDDVASTVETDEGISGRMLLLVDGSDRHIDPSTTDESDGVWINESQPHRWHVENESMTFADALATLGVEAMSDSLTYANETYNESANGTSVAYRVDGTVVENPEEYQIEDGDELFVTVHTSNLTIPGREYSSGHPHAHGSFEATIEGEDINFSRDRYTMNDEYFHFHGDENAGRWHAHSMNLTASYAISSFVGFNVTNGSVTFNETTYDGNQTTVRVNDQPVDPDSYVLKDGDDLELVVNETE